MYGEMTALYLGYKMVIEDYLHAISFLFISSSGITHLTFVTYLFYLWCPAKPLEKISQSICIRLIVVFFSCLCCFYFGLFSLCQLPMTYPQLHKFMTTIPYFLN